MLDTLRARSLAVGTLLAAAAAAAPSYADCSEFTFDVLKDLYQPNENVEFVVCGPPGTLTVAFIDLVPGPTFLPGIPQLDIGFSPVFTICQPGFIPPTGCLTDTKVFPCDSFFIDKPIYVQVCGILPTMEICCPPGQTVLVSNTQGVCPPEPCGPCEGKVTDLELYYGGSVVDAHVVVTQKKGEIIFNGLLQPGEKFSFTGTDKGTMSPEITVTINGGSELAIHTSCSQPIGPGLTFGDFTIISAASKDGGPMCPPGV